MNLNFYDRKWYVNHVTWSIKMNLSCQNNYIHNYNNKVMSFNTIELI